MWFVEGIPNFLELVGIPNFLELVGIPNFLELVGIPNFLELVGIPNTNSLLRTVHFVSLPTKTIIYRNQARITDDKKKTSKCNLNSLSTKFYQNNLHILYSIFTV